MLAGWVASTVLEKLETLHRSFLWRNGTNRGMHLLNWGSVTQVKGQGGLGLKNLHTFFTSLMGPILLKYLNLVDVPWVGLICAKYGSPEIFRSREVMPRPKSSSFWRHCYKVMRLIGGGFFKQIGNGRSTNLYEDPWFFDLPLAWMPTFINSEIDMSQFTVNTLM